MANKVEFGSRIGLIAATVGSAVGLGNVWRFPAETQANGGAAFLIVYILAVFILGIPVMIAEFSLGRGGGSDAVGALKNIGASRVWWGIGFLAILASYLILSFYMVVAGWTLEYLWQSITGHLYAPVEGESSLNGTFAVHMREFIERPWNPLINTYVMILINIFVLARGVQKGIEKISNVLMPLLFMLLLVFAGVAFTLPEAAEGLRFFFHPDFSKLTPTVLLNALGQAFFSLSLGMGILITYSSYFPRSTKLVRTSVTVSLLDLTVAVMMGMIIFPAVMSFGLQGEGLEGATLVFVTLPEVFSMMPGTQLWSILFFLLLLVAAVTSTISLAEVSIRFLQDRFGMKRIKACLVVLLPLFALSTLCSLSQGVLADFRIAGYTIFDGLDMLATNIMLPLGSLLLCIYLGWFAPKKLLPSEITNHGKLRVHFLPVIIFIIRYVAPILIFIVLITPLLKKI